MALAMFQLKGSLHLVAAYESGMATVSRLYLAMGTWATVYRHQAHTQPVLSLDLSPSLDFFISSSADAVIAKHPIPAPCPPAEPSTLDDNSLGDSKSAPATVTTPLKVVNTKHAGQQGLQIRSDGTIFATAGWDSRIRVYSAKTMKEVAVLKWHTVSCFATAFSSMTVKPEDPSLESNIAQASQDGRAGGNSTQLASSSKVDLTVQERRIRHAETAHWLAAGSKDGKVSLWDIY
jgi:WD40 repeat protein